MDLSLYRDLNSFTARHDWLYQPMHFFAVDGQLLFIVLLALLFLAGGKYRSLNGRRATIAAGFSVAAALLVAQVIAHIWDRPRPYEAHPQDAQLLLPPSPDPSFPSDHTTAAFAIAVAVALRHRKAGCIMLVLATLISIGRVALGIHYPSDILGGAVLGTLVALLFWAPPIRSLLNTLADLLGGFYDRLISRQRDQ